MDGPRVLDAHREELIQTCPEKRASYRRFQQITGVGPVVGAGLLQALDRIPFRSADAFVAYTGLVTTIPRAGGDYVWQSRILGSGIGFVMAATGWWFILWLWAPIYGAVLSEEFFQPLWATFNSPSGAAWFAVVGRALLQQGLAGLARLLGLAELRQRDVVFSRHGLLLGLRCVGAAKTARDQIRHSVTSPQGCLITQSLGAFSSNSTKRF